ncbi:MAG TPA: hypothetical protein VG188_02870 [Solirubrobacteraceae bacterium]|jgi:hypothetical protein|nr:hypothetical protein [Solirubrobacteraceae bacterium]
MAFDLKHALGTVTKPTGANGKPPTTAQKRQYSDDLSRVFSEALEKSMRTHFPRTSSGGGTGTNAASASGIKSIDVAFNIEGLFLGLGLSVKTIGLPERNRGYTHNFKRVGEEWVLETVNYHRYMPYAIVVGMLFLPRDAMSDRTKVTSLATATQHFAAFRGRTDYKDDLDLLEEIYIGVYAPYGSNAGDVFFITPEPELGARALPSPARRLSFEEVKDRLVADFKQRNRKLKVDKMP